MSAKARGIRISSPVTSKGQASFASAESTWFSKFVTGPASVPDILATRGRGAPGP